MAGFDPHGFVYILREAGSNDGFYKIGLTTGHPDFRVGQLQTGNPRSLKQVAVFPFAKTEVKRVEDWIHDKLGQYKVDGPSREWFKLTKDELQMVMFELFKEMQNEWKSYMLRDDVRVFASWGSNYKYGVLPLPEWLLAHREDTRPVTVPEL